MQSSRAAAGQYVRNGWAPAAAAGPQRQWRRQSPSGFFPLHFLRKFPTTPRFFLFGNVGLVVLCCLIDRSSPAAVANTGTRRTSRSALIKNQSNSIGNLKKITKLKLAGTQNKSMSAIVIPDDDDEFYASVDLDAIVADAKKGTNGSSLQAAPMQDPQQRARLRDILFDLFGYSEVCFPRLKVISIVHVFFNFIAVLAFNGRSFELSKPMSSRLPYNQKTAVFYGQLDLESQSAINFQPCMQRRLYLLFRH